MRVPILLGWLLSVGFLPAEARPPRPAARSVPRPLPDHPGNVFLAGEEVVLRPPDGTTNSWHLFDFEGREMAAPPPADGRLNLGRLPVGYYQLRAAGGTSGISCAVLAALKVPTPPASPVGLDVAMSWFYAPERMSAAASLCALAGVNWTRDRLAWGQLEPRPGQWSGPGRYDQAAQAQARFGLRVLQVNHTSPPWANPATGRFPLDLRDAYRFYREAARRFRGQVLAFEPWNEADIPDFGGHTGAEMAAMQKASYLGLKAGGLDLVVCQNVFALHNAAQLADLRDNEAWPYFDTFNLHHYAPFDDYPKLYADFRAVSAGRPLWVSECAWPVHWSGDQTLQEPSPADLRLQAERIAKTYACSLHEGAENIFYFLLPHYVEGPTQFGLLRPDLTPRPAFAALAAVGRLLAGAKPAGRLRSEPAALRGFVFHARPDGRAAHVLVAWCVEGQVRLALPAPPTAVFDLLGRPLTAGSPLLLGSGPVFALLSDSCVRRIELQPPPPPAPRLTGSPSPVVIQAICPQSDALPQLSAYRISSQKPEAIPLFIYNFSEAPVVGRLRLELPAGWKASAGEPVRIAPQSRVELALDLDCREGAPAWLEQVRVVGDFGAAGKPVLSLRLLPEPSLLVRQAGLPIPGADVAGRWQPTCSGGGQARIVQQDQAVGVAAEPLGPDKWVYATLSLPADQRPPAGAIGFACNLRLRDGGGLCRAIFDETNGSSYVADFLPQPDSGQETEVVALFEQATYGAGWSKPDPNGKLDPPEIASLKIGANLKSGKVEFSFQHLRWLVK